MSLRKVFKGELWKQNETERNYITTTYLKFESLNHFLGGNSKNSFPETFIIWSTVKKYPLSSLSESNYTMEKDTLIDIGPMHFKQGMTDRDTEQ